MTDVPDIATPMRTQAIMNSFGINTKKSLGQNFLTDINILKNIVAAGDVQPTDNVIEIGPGIGALTEQLARAAKQVVAFEIDDRLIPVLEHTMAPYDNVTVVNQDILTVDLEQAIKEHFTDPEAPLKLVANLPYYITTPILMQVLQSDVKFANIVVMMQKEVASRLSAEVGTKDYGALTLAVQYRMNATLAFTVSRTAFVPNPNVDSAIISLTPREPLKVLPHNEKQLFNLFKIGFTMRRKTLWNNLITAFGKDDAMKAKLTAALADIDLDPRIRAEKLSLEKFIDLHNALVKTGVYSK
ncbi:16S rRNA (adenine(1518)-N(6)/adenine(1519)-N(6))-dimethyltransferase RsmA [Weissella paramesenteroides]|jgi:16S rRNA (adenine1518-N6/adenine1519-N6)-dimethyltransferase|uniref:16S rRNA (adenine(1518)-N(6)/adenine(1519)-N(6))- dimethyltransferase RsmA n=1 Tax=Weissella paramesenteroides TaxID=1249 RepID=UPI00123AADB7|nr:16S rRNA (adenine(1518)-N(6)/adenine(1519)-N(6))-dimethyltransferase RsmA [Weissella paramesenteroides]KAA8440294.1 16S rRNA (adenine(1518)-N(6)/adenine(1519)-N(6))-dimethyltransferase RsmA [Weissella paramesenteroides]KAA8440574.1 16S rRNA (adenine(1518)-N(6)/adenine(1519)-N(6))-dimethyltransferase RsmA [Weissella paramesenteroides]KAA8440669.1 16S rRNA (adenine(1518)-N(6)/adenine(1519)-N(6))-dimethyltransferase RsmA [Weissella paramesenteroides]KAA8445717.1 16S rRNA (adenine(1518)-N(6)/ade